MRLRLSRTLSMFVCVLAVLVAGARASAATSAAAGAAAAAPTAENVLTPLQQRQAEAAVDRALEWLSTQQAPDGSFVSADPAQPAVTGLCVLAYLSRGHLPGHGPYGENIANGINYILSTQRTTGLFSRLEPQLGHVHRQPGQTAIYNHTISCLALTEAYGMADRDLSQKMKPAIEQAVAFTLRLQTLQTPNPQRDRGGWRYVVTPDSLKSDLCVTSWVLLDLRSAKNAGFAVPSGATENALEYVRRCFDERQGMFIYIKGAGRPITRAMAAAGVLSMSLAGDHDSDIARESGDWILRNNFTGYKQQISVSDRFYYGLFYCSQAMFQLGGRHWRAFFPGAVRLLIDNQEEAGSWDVEVSGDVIYGKTYSTALAVLALETPHQLLPIFQR